MALEATGPLRLRARRIAARRSDLARDALQPSRRPRGQHQGWPAILLPYGRVKVAEAVGDALEPQLVINLIGKRPGGDARASRSMSAYLAYRLSDEKVRQQAAAFSGHPDIRYEYTVISNIYDGGLPPVEAGSAIAEQAISILEHRAAGNRLAGLAQASSGGSRSAT